MAMAGSREKCGARCCLRSEAIATILALTSSPRGPDSRVEAVSSAYPNRRSHSRATGAGVTLAASVALFAYGGLWLDERFGTRPWCMLALVLCGIVGGILHVIRVLAPEAWPFGELPRSSSSTKNDPKNESPGGPC